MVQASAAGIFGELGANQPQGSPGANQVESGGN